YSGVSIHAPVQGANADLDHRLLRWTVSIHAPVQGAKVHYLTKKNSKNKKGFPAKLFNFQRPANLTFNPTPELFFKIK
ncbi:MAG: hypothetical protein NTV04_18725, partial [Deltaproteobacteria bacterium]|nr:hypothetical protein [Deltaproteobacteria bacterium]